MKNFSIKDIYSNKVKINEKIKVYGWVRSKRDSKKGISFIDIFDGTCLLTLQAVAKSNLENYEKEIIKLTSGCSLVVTGNIIFSRRQEQKYELLIIKLKVLGLINNPDKYPISLKKHTFEYLRKFAHLRVRTKFFCAISKIRNVLFSTINNFLYKKNFTWVPTPIITGLNTEGSGAMFSVFSSNNDKAKKLSNFKNIFKNKNFLTVSGQLTLESYALALSKVYNFGPTFRSEDSNTKRHLSEFWMLEVEVAFFNLKKIVHLSKIFLKYITEHTLEKCIFEIEFLEKYFSKNIIKNLKNLINLDYVEIEYKDLIKLLNVLGKSISFGEDISLEQEKYVVNKHFCKPLIVKNFPKNLKAFYMRDNPDNVTVASMDIFLPNIGEVLGGSQREERLKILDNKLKKFNLGKDKYWWYRDLRKYGTVIHSGFGIGFERLLCYFTGIDNIRDASPFPKTLRKFYY
ncbi:asparagine--tRNA ligase [Buchnera aphidicola (Chaitoregma tattakana)]|uniref:asparagine--tRNA ligase n=1 Tax=Buchnera aphidicola TaxID=9 RepID=UPI0031B89EFD